MSTTEIISDSSDKPLLEVHQLAKAFGNLNVFDNLSFRMAPREVLGVIGPNGAGKTTLINVLSGQLAASSGTVLLDRDPISRLPFHARARKGMIRSFQHTNIFSEESVSENLSRAKHFSRSTHTDDDGARSLLDSFGLSDKLDHPAVDLPYGLQKMLGLVMVYITGPRVLLLDEPAAGLENRERILVDQFVETALDRLSCGILIVEHDMNMVRRLCPRLIVLDDGQILAEGDTADVLRRSDVIEAYLGVAEEKTDAEG